MECVINNFPTYTTTLTTNSKGKVCLGSLENVKQVTARFYDVSVVSDTWQIQHKSLDSWTYSDEIHILEGENVEIPVSFYG
jgi:hypothetical protein